jgi:phospholipase/lecithinase/hemolysin
MYVFGDSTVDSGWWKGALTTPSQCGPVTTPCETGNPTKDSKISDAIAAANGAPVSGAGVGVGQMNTQYIAQHFLLSAEPANQGGTNFAIAGSVSAPLPTIFNGNVMPLGGNGNLNVNPSLPATNVQISTYLAAHAGAADPGSLYLISSGGNDITYAKDNVAAGDQQAFLSAQASALAIAIQSLQLDGAQHIVVYGAQGSGGLAQFWTSQLFGDLNTLNVAYTGADIAGLIQTVENNPTQYGFTSTTVHQGVPGSNTESACVAGLGATGWGQFCGNVTDPQPNFSHLFDANAEGDRFWADDQHLSDAGQQIEANYVIGLLEPTPLPGAVWLLGSVLVGSAGVGGWRKSKRAAKS